MAVLVLAGGLTQTAVQVAVRMPIGLRPQRRATAAVFRALASGYADSSGLWSGRTARAIDVAGATLRPAALVVRRDAEALRGMVDEARRIRLELITIEGLADHLSDVPSARAAVDELRRLVDRLLRGLADAARGTPGRGGHDGPGRTPDRPDPCGQRGVDRHRRRGVAGRRHPCRIGSDRPSLPVVARAAPGRRPAGRARYGPDGRARRAQPRPDPSGTHGPEGRIRCVPERRRGAVREFHSGLPRVPARCPTGGCRPAPGTRGPAPRDRSLVLDPPQRRRGAPARLLGHDEPWRRPGGRLRGRGRGDRCAPGARPPRSDDGDGHRVPSRLGRLHLRPVELRRRGVVPDRPGPAPGQYRPGRHPRHRRRPAARYHHRWLDRVDRLPPVADVVPVRGSPAARAPRRVPAGVRRSRAVAFRCRGVGRAGAR